MPKMRESGIIKYVIYRWDDTPFSNENAEYFDAVSKRQAEYEVNKRNKKKGQKGKWVYAPVYDDKGNPYN
jgi:hypothetical protein